MPEETRIEVSDYEKTFREKCHEYLLGIGFIPNREGEENRYEYAAYPFPDRKNYHVRIGHYELSDEEKRDIPSCVMHLCSCAIVSVYQEDSNQDVNYIVDNVYVSTIEQLSFLVEHTYPWKMILLLNHYGAQESR